VIHTPAARIAPRLTRARASASAPDTNTAADPESDENADSSGMKPYYNLDIEEEYGVHKTNRQTDRQTDRRTDKYGATSNHNSIKQY
jgi:hypothetical protein